MIRVNPKLKKELERYGEFNANQCFSCGTCTALCPMGLKILPREIFRFSLLGSEEKLKEAEDAIYSCLLCRMCEANCPQGVKISENIRILRTYFTERVFKI